MNLFFNIIVFHAGLDYIYIVHFLCAVKKEKLIRLCAGECFVVLELNL